MPANQLERQGIALDRKEKPLAVPIEIRSGVKVDKVDEDYLYIREEGFTIYYKQGINKTTPWDDEAKAAWKVLADKGFANLADPSVT